MYTDRINLFPKNFQLWVMHNISLLREMFIKEHRMRAANRDGGMLFGTRFNSDERVLHAAIASLKMPQFDNSFEGDNSRKRWAMSLEISWHTDHTLMRRAIEEGFKKAAEADYYYEYEKQYE